MSDTKPARPAPPSDILDRKQDHIDLVLAQREGRPPANEFDRLRLPHNALPDIDLGDVDLSVRFLGQRLKLPFLISSMTGGPKLAETINTHLAEAAQHLGVALGVGSQRVALENAGAGGLHKKVRAIARDVPLLANLGAVQLIEPGGVDMARRAVDMLEADALILHLNPMQEALQTNGDTNWRGVADAMATTIKSVGVPVVVKEVGFGLSGDVARRLVAMGVAALDVAGSGGTNFGAVELARQQRNVATDFGDPFLEWGLSTVDALEQVRQADLKVPVVASGGIRHGLDAAKAIALGATVVGQAGPVLKAAIDSTDAVLAHFESMSQSLRLACFGCGVARPADLPRPARI